MLKSMTGYGRGEALLYDRKFVVEMKSVNHRYSDINIKMPRSLNSFEDIMRREVAGAVARGKVDIYVNMESFSQDDVKIVLNKPLADAYMSELKLIIETYGLQDKITLANLLSFSDVLKVEKEIQNDQTLSEIGEGVLVALKGALGQFLKMRESEGEALKRDILQKNESIKETLTKIIALSPKVVEEYRDRLIQKVQELLNNVSIDENRLLMEVVLYSDKTCVDEELTRLSSHVEQLVSILNEKETVGRKLDFLVQEMNREINTIGSKSNDIEITKLVVDLKCEVEKIREQIQNIE